MNAQELKQARKNAGLSLRQLGEISGVNHITIHNIENGTIENPAYDKIKALAQALNIDIIQTDDIVENQLVQAWRDNDMALILKMVSDRIEDKS